MTCIIGLEHEGRVYMGADSYLGNGHTFGITRERKLFRRGEFLVGTAGDVRFGQLLAYHMTMPEAQGDEPDAQYLVMEFVEPLRAMMKEHGFATIENSVEKTGNRFLLGYRGRLYRVWDYQVDSYVNGLICIGSGEEVAYGAMMALEALPPRKRIKRALAIAADRVDTVAPPFYVEAL
jgi:ATP-dependent protease HslVU (ClpYQ) peptidase subunit